MKKIILASFLFFIANQSFSQNIPAQRLVNWSNAGLTGSVAYPNLQLNILNYGADSTGANSCNSALNNAINALNGQFGIIYFPKGHYLFDTTIYLSDSLIIKGAGSDSTKFLFDLPNSGFHSFNISGNTQNTIDTLSYNPLKYQNFIVHHGAISFNTGDYVEIRQMNDTTWDTSPAAWAEYSVGQVCKVSGVSGDTIFLQEELRADFSTSLYVQIRKMNPKKSIGLECFYIERISDSAAGAGYNFYFTNATESWIKGIESNLSSGAHVGVFSSSHLSILNSYFHHAFIYDGSGTRGYGVCLLTHASDVLVQNNCFRHLRHSMMVKQGANGNVFGYNYSLEPNRSEPIPTYSGDISLHGHYPYCNLFEGNIVQNIIIDHYWGESGPYNTFLRNRCELFGLIMTNGNPNATKSQNYIANEVINMTPLYGNYTLTGTDHFEYGNNIKNTCTPAGTQTVNTNSLYLTSYPYFWKNALPYPSVGYANTLNQYSNPAKMRFDAADYAPCEIDTALAPSTVTYIDKKPGAFIYPHPCSDVLYIQLEKDNPGATVQLITFDGKIVLSEAIKNKGKLHVSHLPSGIYYCVVKSASGVNAYTILKE